MGWGWAARPRGGCQGRGTPRKAEVPWAGWELPLLHRGRSRQRCVCGCSAPGEDRRKTGCAPAGFTSAGPGHGRAGQQQRNLPTFVFVSANCKNRSEVAEPRELPRAGHGHVLRDALQVAERGTCGRGGAMTTINSGGAPQAGTRCSCFRQRPWSPGSPAPCPPCAMFPGKPQRNRLTLTQPGCCRRYHGHLPGDPRSPRGCFLSQRGSRAARCLRVHLASVGPPARRLARSAGGKAAPDKIFLTA